MKRRVRSPLAWLAAVVTAVAPAACGESPLVEPVVIADAAAHAGANQTATVGTAVPIRPAIRVVDQNDRGVPNVPLTFTPGANSGTVTGGTTTTDLDGIGVIGGWTLGTTAGTQTLTVTVPGLGTRTITATALAGAPTQVAAQPNTNAQTAVAGSPVAVAPAVRVADQYGNPVSGISVTWAVTSGGGSVTGSLSTTTNAQGVAAVTAWTLGAAVGTNTLTATAGSLPVVTFTATGTAGPPASITILAGNGQTATVGSAVATAPSVRVRDAGGNNISGASVTFAVTAGGGTLVNAVRTTDANGVATVGSWTLGTTAGTNTVTATVGSVAPATFTATGTPGAPTALAKASTDSLYASLGTAAPRAPIVRVRDQYGNGVPNTQVTFTVAAGGGWLNSAGTTTVTAASDAQGLARVTTWTVGSTAGANRVNAALTANAAVATNFTVTAVGAPTNLLKISSTDQQTAPISTAVPQPPTVIVRDAANNPVPGVTVNWSVQTGGGNLGGVTTLAVVSDSLGNSKVNWTLGTVVGTQSIAAAATGVTTQTFTATATPGNPASVATNVSAPASVQAGAVMGFIPSVIVRDAQNNAVPNVTVTWAVNAGNGRISNATTSSTQDAAATLTSTTNASGVATLNQWTASHTVGNDTLTATVTGVAAPARFVVAVTAAAPSAITVTAGNSQTAAPFTAVPVAPAVTVRDAYGNAVPSIQVNFAVTLGGGSLTSASPFTNANGLATVGSWTLGSAGAQSLSASLPAYPGVTAAQFTATAQQVNDCTNGNAYTIGTTVNGTLASTDCVTAGYNIDPYRLTLGSQSFLRITSSSSVFQPEQRTYPYGNTAYWYVNGNNTVNQWLLAPAGTAIVRVTSTTAGATGSYSFSAVSTTAAASFPTGCDIVTATKGVSNFSASLSSAHCQYARRNTGGTTQTGTYYGNLYGIYLNAGTTLTVRMNATFDTFLELYTDSGTWIMGNDDVVSGNTNSVISYNVTTAGFYIIRATSYNTTTTGSYTFTIDP